jgi:hypothetical protein
MAEMPTLYRPGDLVWWHREPRGGYGFQEEVAGVVVRQTAKRVRIKIARRFPFVGGCREWTKVEVSVTPGRIGAWDRLVEYAPGCEI